MKIILGTFLILLVTVSCNNSSSQEKNDKFSDWALKNSQKIETLETTEKQDDLNLLKQIVRKAEVVVPEHPRKTLPSFKLTSEGMYYTLFGNGMQGTLYYLPYET